MRAQYKSELCCLVPFNTDIARDQVEGFSTKGIASLATRTEKGVIHEL
jgi:hypothetical protein